MRIAALLTTLALAVSAAAPAGACVIQAPGVTYFFDAIPNDLRPNELVLEVRYESREPYKTAPFFSLGDEVIGSGASTDRLSVVRVVRGEFKGGTILIPANAFCSPVATQPADGAATGLVVGFATPPSLEWTDAPALVARFRTSREEDASAPVPAPLSDEPVDPSTVAAARAGDPAAMMVMAKSVRDPSVRKTWFDQAAAGYRSRAGAGDTSAMIELGLALRSAEPVDSRRWFEKPPAPYPDPAAEWLERAALSGDVRGMIELAESLDTRSMGVRFPELRVQATKWFIKAAETGHACSMGRLAQRYRFGWGAPVDKDKAVFWFRKATAAGAIMSPYGYTIEDNAPRSGDIGSLPTLKCPAGS